MPETVEVALEARVARRGPEHADPVGPAGRLRGRRAWDREQRAGEAPEQRAAAEHAASMPHRTGLC